MRILTLGLHLNDLAGARGRWRQSIVVGGDIAALSSGALAGMRWRRGRRGSAACYARLMVRSGGGRRCWPIGRVGPFGVGAGGADATAPRLGAVDGCRRKGEASIEVAELPISLLTRDIARRARCEESECARHGYLKRVRVCRVARGDVERVEKGG